MTALTTFSVELLTKFALPCSVIMMIGLVIESGVWKESFWMVIIGFELIHLTFLVESLGCIICPFTLIFSIYYHSAFDQLNKSIKSISISGSIPVSTMIKLIYRHKQLSLQVIEINHFIRRSMATFFVISALIQHLLIYEGIYSNNIIHKFIALYGSVVYFFLGFGLCYLLSWTSHSAHQSYKVIFSILSRRKMNLRVKFKVWKNNFLFSKCNL